MEMVITSNGSLRNDGIWNGGDPVLNKSSGVLYCNPELFYVVRELCVLRAAYKVLLRISLLIGSNIRSVNLAWFRVIFPKPGEVVVIS